jgi:nitrate reductase molybdenum cofactor assembly chaperone NarJ/NarW
VLGRADLVREALAEGAPAAAGHFTELLDGWRSGPPAQLQADYVELFDLSRKHTLYLSYWTDGDTRRRGQVLAEVKQYYRRSAFLVNLRGELPDYLPVVLEYAAMAGPKDGIDLLQRYRASLELIRLSLAEPSAAYGAVLQAVCETLPGASPADRQAALAMARSGPPREAVGLDPYDPRLLPFVDSATR